MKRMLSKVLPIIIVPVFLGHGPTPVSAADALGMIEVRGLRYEDFEIKAMRDVLDGTSNTILLTAKGEGELHFDGRPDLNAIILLRQAFTIADSHFDDGPDSVSDNTQLSGRTSGAAEIIIFGDTGGAEAVFGPFTFSGSYVGRSLDGLSYALKVHAAFQKIFVDPTPGDAEVDADTIRRLQLDLDLVLIDHVGAGFVVTGLEGDGVILSVGNLE